MVSAGDQVKKYGAEAADKISHINAKQAEAEGENDVKKLQKEVSCIPKSSVHRGAPKLAVPNMTAGGKAATPDLAELAHEQSSNRHADTTSAAPCVQHDMMSMAQELAYEHGM